MHWNFIQMPQTSVNFVNIFPQNIVPLLVSSSTAGWCWQSPGIATGTAINTVVLGNVGPRVGHVYSNPALILTHIHLPMHGSWIFRWTLLTLLLYELWSWPSSCRVIHLIHGYLIYKQSPVCLKLLHTPVLWVPSFSGFHPAIVRTLWWVDWLGSRRISQVLHWSLVYTPSWVPERWLAYAWTFLILLWCAPLSSRISCQKSSDICMPSLSAGESHLLFIAVPDWCPLKLHWALPGLCAYLRALLAISLRPQLWICCSRL